jgi:hypothetical protein
MKIVEYIEKSGWKRRITVKDDATAKDYPAGIPSGPPDLTRMDIGLMLMQMNNVLIEAGIFNWDDVQRKPGGLQPALNVVKKHLVALYRERL